MYIAHKRDDGKLQPLKDHLIGVAESAAGFAAVFDAADHAWAAGLIHDAGKYSRKGQQRMMDPDHVAKVDHSTAGAKIALEILRDRMLAECAAGHHGGLMDMGSKFSAEGDGTLLGRCRKQMNGAMSYDAFFQEMSDFSLQSKPPLWLLKQQTPFRFQFYTRMLFSCLVDADFLDTESFFEPARKEIRKSEDHIPEMEQLIRTYIQPWLKNPQNAINRQRSNILQTCLDAASQPPGLYSLTVPTGGGKTVSSLAFAAAHANYNHQKRIIYVIPYTSIIEQNAEVFRQIVGEERVLEHHHLVDYTGTEDSENEADRRKMLATENWNAPVVVTTAVQFFESLFSNKNSRCRKLHNIANSVIIFDEAQMLPLHYLQACVCAIAELVLNYHVTAVLCTATQPSLNKLFQAYDSSLIPKEIFRNAEAARPVFQRVTYTTESLADTDCLASKLSEKKQVLCIVNRRKTAQELFQKLPENSRFHLSTLMTAEHRSEILEQVRERLKSGQPCHLVSTSLIEAGVDIDFQEVWREIAGLDSIIQAAGRCNREGKRDVSASVVTVFSLGNRPPRSMEMNVKAAEMVMEKSRELDSAASIKTYYDYLLWMLQDRIDQSGIMKLCGEMAFESIAERFHLIDSETKTVYIPTETNEALLDELAHGRVNRAIMRKLAKNAVNIYPWEFEELRKAGKVKDVMENAAILADKSAYSSERGLILQFGGGDALWI